MRLDPSPPYYRRRFTYHQKSSRAKRPFIFFLHNEAHDFFLLLHLAPAVLPASFAFPSHQESMAYSARSCKLWRLFRRASTSWKPAASLAQATPIIRVNSHCPTQCRTRFIRSPCPPPKYLHPTVPAISYAARLQRRSRDFASYNSINDAMSAPNKPKGSLRIKGS